MEYQKAKAEVVLFDNSDVITASSLDDHYQEEADKFKEENPNVVWGCSDLASKLEGK